jgi:uncharacterized protein
MAVAKHVPTRTCIATRVKKPKGEMVRLVRLPDPQDPKKYIVIVDASGKARGRGANLDSKVEAFDLAVQKQAIENALKLERKLVVDEVTKLRNDFLQLIEEREFRQGKKPVFLKVSKEELDRKLKSE